MWRSSENGGTNDSFSQEKPVFSGRLPGETQHVSEENQNELRTKMGVDPAQWQLFWSCSVLLPYCAGIAPAFLLTLFGCCSGTPYETQDGPEENQNNLRTKMGVNPAQYRRTPEQDTVSLCDEIYYNFFGSCCTRLLPSFETRSGLVRELFEFHWESPEESRRNVEQILDQSAMRLGRRS
jgi:hypothetical protein